MTPAAASAAASRPAQPDKAEIRAGLALLAPPIFEIRVLEPRPKPFTRAGYFNDLDLAARHAAQESGHAAGVYFLVNEIPGDLLARRVNRIDVSGKMPSVADSDITRRRRLVFDIDPVRPSGISATDAEQALALETGEAMRQFLTAFGFLDGALVSSGNGANLYFGLDLPNDAASTEIIRRVLRSAAAWYDSDAVKVDQTVYNAARIMKIPGTLACKGDSTATRPHRYSRILYAPDTLAPVDLAVLQALADDYLEPEPASQAAASRPAYTGDYDVDLDAFVRETGLHVRHEHNRSYGRVLVLEACPFNSAHTDKAAVLIKMNGGAVVFRCQHNGCAGKGWRELRAFLNWRPRIANPLEIVTLHTVERPVTNGKHPEAVPTPPAVITPIADHPNEHLTDMGNARRLVRYFGQNLRYTEAWGALCWDGRRFERDTTGAAIRMAQATVGRMYTEAGTLPETERAALAKWALTSESGPHLREIVKLAQSQIEIAAKHSAFDTDPWLLNCNNGTVDLRTIELRPHNRADMLTKVAPVDYDPAAECPLWLNFLNRIFSNNQALISFLQRAVGYSISGSVKAQVMFLCYGTGKNGKSTFLRVLQNILGDYAQSTPTAALLVKDRDGGASPEIARMAGARFVTAIETEDGKRLAVALIKQLTGGDIMTARHLNRDYFEFAPQLKLWLATNHRPVIRDTTESIWRRVLLIPFEVTIPEDERDPNLPELLMCEAPGILAWAVQGCREWASTDLQAPKVVKAATESYRAEMDTLAAFLDECCLTGRSYTVPHAHLYARYKQWSEDNGERPLGGRAFSRGMNEKDYFSRNGTGNAVVWDGLGLRVEGYGDVS